jgi:hypothetical protein
MSKRKKGERELITPRLPERMRRGNQLAHTFADRRKQDRRTAARGRTFTDE